ncbi:MAG: hypothetical protein RQ714_03960 [Nitrosomonas sp.]|nr:hypothetical protein [Nitrosomonas sp.]
MNILAVLMGALRHCRLLAGRGHAARPTPFGFCRNYFFADNVRFASIVKKSGLESFSSLWVL